MANGTRFVEAAYQVQPGGPLDRATIAPLVDRIAATDGHGRALVESFVLPIRSGRAWNVPLGCVCKIIAHEGPQVGDLNLWHAQNPRERLWAARTRQLQAAHVSVYDRLWSTLPYLRPLATITADSLRYYGVDEQGGRVHDLLGTRCDPYINRILSGTDFDYHCHSNLTRAIRPFGLEEHDVHDVLNVFQCTGLNAKDQYYMKACPAKTGDYFEFFAEVPLLCALSTCPGGDLSRAMWGDESSDPDDEDPTLSCCRPLKVEVWKLPNGVLDGWSEPEPAYKEYKGGHALQTREWNGTIS